MSRGTSAARRNSPRISVSLSSVLHRFSSVRLKGAVRNQARALFSWTSSIQALSQPPHTHTHTLFFLHPRSRLSCVTCIREGGELDLGLAPNLERTLKLNSSCLSSQTEGSRLLFPLISLTQEPTGCMLLHHK